VKNKYQVEILEMKEVHELPEAWTNDSLSNFLEHIDYDDIAFIAPEELKEMTAIVLSDLEPDDAIDQTLAYRFGDLLNKGKRQNLIEEVQEDRIWEEYADLSYHKELFNVCCMLYWAFPKKVPEPDIVRISLKVTALNTASEPNIKLLTPSFIARLLNDGMDSHNLIYRLFDEQIASNKFEESTHIIWQVEENGYDPDEHAHTFNVYTAWTWVDELKGVERYESQAFSDGQLN
jgi:hypothetical protein